MPKEFIQYRRVAARAGKTLGEHAYGAFLYRILAKKRVFTRFYLYYMIIIEEIKKK